MKTSKAFIWLFAWLMLLLLVLWPANSSAAEIGGRPAQKQLHSTDASWIRPHMAMNIILAEAAGQRTALSASKPVQKEAPTENLYHSLESVATGMAVKSFHQSNDLMLFQCRYDPLTWTGDVLAFGGRWQGNRLALDPPKWRAADQFKGPGLDWQARRIVTYGGGGINAKGIPFRFEALSQQQHEALLPAPPGQLPNPDDVWELIAFIRGKSSIGFRQRSNQLGDIMHAAPVLAGNTLYVGANDGMLHAFDVNTGTERFAYVPNLVFDHLRHLSSADYLLRHRNFVDATPSVGQVLVGKYKRRTYLIGGLGKGGRGYYCLLLGTAERIRSAEGYSAYRSRFNVDELAAQDAEEQYSQVVQWEYPSTDPTNDGIDNDADGLTDEPGEQDPHLGYSHGQAYAVNANTAKGTYRPVVIFGNGYDSPAGRAVLYVLEAHSGKILRKIFTNLANDNGLSTPALVDVDLDRRIDYAYAGDLHGNLWKFDLRAEDPARWGLAGNGSHPLFRTADQPITGRPDVMAVNPSCNPKASGYLVIFGTGKYLEPGDLSDSRSNGIYGVWDKGPNQFLGARLNLTTGRLSSGRRIKQCNIVQAANIDGEIHRFLSDPAKEHRDPPTDDRTKPTKSTETFDPDSDYAGWYLAFPPALKTQAQTRERVTGQVTLRGGRAVVTSFAPDQAPGAGNGGQSWVYVLDACTGSAVSDADQTFHYPVKYAGCITNNPPVIKNPDRPKPDHLIAWDAAGGLIQSTFDGELQGRVSWRRITE